MDQMNKLTLAGALIILGTTASAQDAPHASGLISNGVSGSVTMNVIKPTVPIGGPMNDDFKRGACWTARIVAQGRMSGGQDITIYNGGQEAVVCKP